MILLFGMINGWGIRFLELSFLGFLLYAKRRIVVLEKRGSGGRGFENGSGVGGGILEIVRELDLSNFCLLLTYLCRYKDHKTYGNGRRQRQNSTLPARHMRQFVVL